MSVLNVEGRHPSTVAQARWFEFEHLSGNQRQVSKEFAVFAQKLILMLGDGPEFSTALRKLVEAKDCAVRQSILDGES